MLKRSLITCSLVGLVLALPGQSLAIPFEFSGSDEGGTGSATLDITISGNSLTAVLNNTSPTTLDSGSGENAPGIVGFGFDADGTIPGITDWELTADTSTTSGTTTVKVIGSNLSGDGADGTPGTLDDSWVLSASIAGESRDFLTTSEGPGVKGALYNPDAKGSSALGAAPNFFTTATLTVTFNDTFTLDETSTFVRFQNVGLDGEGSLKLTGTVVPEPASLFLLGSGLIGLVLWRIKGSGVFLARAERNVAPPSPNNDGGFGIRVT